jgi:hypothetical protein
MTLAPTQARKDGRWMYYRLLGKAAPATVRRAIDWVTQSVNGAPRVAEDVARLKKILAMDPVVLCKCQCGK